MLTSDFDYNLPEELIAQLPCEKRCESRMMVLEKNSKKIAHKHFFDIVDFLDENDVLVLNNTKVIPARLFGQKLTGANVEVFLLKDLGNNHWEALLKPSKRINGGNIIKISPELGVKAIRLIEGGKWLIEFLCKGHVRQILQKVGNIPLPPYIERNLSNEDIKKLDFERYQTVFAQKEGSVAAPTAGLHFTKEILEKLEKKGVQIAYVTLDVGLGTFRPVKCENILEHKMETETFEITEETAKIINEAKKNKKNIVAVGTTSVRTLETAFQKYGEIKACKGFSELFIYPPYEFKVVDKLLTNFHLPKSTLLMLTSAFAEREFVLEAYKNAITEKYRFYSYGDCMFIY
ncbi:MAG TPA: tRNA preQ1(34) S-adenosylmethionine ribosyltransferase-isomerase QueA [Candidatus Gastranaerophilaceae bacterium]|nr:tRNA preQ1(34) S-adenosylmethionine ribosyltransferase-isomerase QueA [Candidatus Gastranaerophilaceae bacterium]HPT41109.1 tRNA preQ1(34) S-adenosylmethionine ribosyltransferase-isomerase QueA [Candidatus Gastranaerophilaceae bacterium]